MYGIKCRSNIFVFLCYDQSVKDSMQTRVMSYAGSFTPVKWKCRAPMPSGKLCERMDRVKVCRNKHLLVYATVRYCIYRPSLSSIQSSSNFIYLFVLV